MKFDNLISSNSEAILFVNITVYAALKLLILGRKADKNGEYNSKTYRFVT